MTGVVRVVMGGQPTATVTIRDNVFDRSDVTVGMGGMVTWENKGINEHTATEAATGTLLSYALNGRTFVGNTPIVVAQSGRRIRWYVFNLDLEMTWHNFHLHGARWRWAGDIVDTRGLSSAESFVADTVVPPVVLLPDPECEAQASDRTVSAHGGPGHPGPPHGGGSHAGGPHGGGPHGGGPHGGGSHGGGSGYEPERVRVRGDFLIHCHVEPHMMQGMAGLVRAVQDLDIRPDEIPELGGQPLSGRRLADLLFSSVPPVVDNRARREGGAMPLLDDDAVEEGLQRLPGWERRGDQIMKTFVREDFAHAMTFVNEVAGAAEAAGHHPNIDIRWNKVTLVLSSHAEGGLTESDFQLAARIEELDQPTQPA